MSASNATWALKAPFVSAFDIYPFLLSLWTQHSILMTCPVFGVHYIQKRKGVAIPDVSAGIEMVDSVGVKGDNELSLRLALRRGVHATNHDYYAYNEPQSV